MALLFLDSFDHYTDAADKYLSGGTAIVAAGRHGAGWDAASRLRLAPTPTSNRFIFGAAFKFTSAFNVILSPADVSHAIATVYTENDGSIQIDIFGGAGATARSAPDLIRLNQWHYLECDFTVVTTPSGPFLVYSLAPAVVYLDGALVLTAASLGPGNVTDPPLVTQYNWRYLDICPNAAGTIDDLYLCDGSGPAPHNGPLGDVQIDVLRPNGPGAVTEWTPEGAPAGWSATDDLTPDDDTTRVVATTAGLSDLYALEDVNTGNSILGAQLLVSACRTQAGPAALAPLLRHAGVTTPLPAQALASSYFYRNRECFVTMPNGDPLTDANINALQAGIRRTV